MAKKEADLALELHHQALRRAGHPVHRQDQQHVRQEASALSNIDDLEHLRRQTTECSMMNCNTKALPLGPHSDDGQVTTACKL